MNSILWIFIFVLALAVLVKSSKLFVDSCDKGVKSLGWSAFFVGMTLLALSTALPELASSLWAVQTDTTTLVASNVIGSNVANVLLVLGLGAILYKGIEITQESARSVMGLLLGTTFLMLVTLYDGTVQWYEGCVLIAAYIMVLLSNAEAYRTGTFQSLKNLFSRERMDGKSALTLVLSGAAVGVSSYFTVTALEEISSKAHVMPSILGASLLALGTTLPEMILIFSALKKGKTDLAVGAIVGSSIINATLVLGIPALFAPLTVSSDMLTLGIPFLLISTLIALFALSQRKLSSYEGALHVLLYSVFVFQLLTSF